MYAFRFGSRSFSINTDEIKSILRGAAVALAGALVPILASLTGSLDDGTIQGALLASAAAVVANVIRKFVTDNSDTPQ